MLVQWLVANAEHSGERKWVCFLYTARTRTCTCRYAMALDDRRELPRKACVWGPHSLVAEVQFGTLMIAGASIHSTLLLVDSHQ